jgi:hypothetical protein
MVRQTMKYSLNQLTGRYIFVDYAAEKQNALDYVLALGFLALSISENEARCAPFYSLGRLIDYYFHIQIKEINIRL